MLPPGDCYLIAFRNLRSSPVCDIIIFSFHVNENTILFFYFNFFILVEKFQPVVVDVVLHERFFQNHYN